MAAGDLAGRIAALEQELAALKAQLRADVSARGGDRSAEPPDGAGTSRRGMLRHLAVGAAGVAGAVVVGARPAAAANGDPVNVGETVSGDLPTQIQYTGATQHSAAVWVQSGSATTNDEPAFQGKAAFAGVADDEGAQDIGVTGWSRKPAGTGVGVFGFSPGYGGEFLGGAADLRLRAGGAAPLTTTIAHLSGELVHDGDGNLWVCVGDGTPGTWRLLAGPATTGALSLLPAPVRAYDSRGTGGPIGAGQERTVDLSVAVPEGASGVLANLTATNAAALGYLAVFAYGVTWPGNSSLNFAPDLDLANSVTSAISADRQVTVRGGGGPGAEADFIIDVVGYYT